MTQLFLFEAKRETRETWVMSEKGQELAADILGQLLRETGGPVTAAMMVKEKLGIKVEVNGREEFASSVPDSLARVYADQVEAVIEERDRIKSRLEDRNEFLLTVVDANGKPAIRGGKPVGFALRGSIAGQAGTAAQVAMNAAAIRAELRRYHKARGLNDQGIDAVLDMIPSTAALLGTQDATEVNGTLALSE